MGKVWMDSKRPTQYPLTQISTLAGCSPIAALEETSFSTSAGCSPIATLDENLLWTHARYPPIATLVENLRMGLAPRAALVRSQGADPAPRSRDHESIPEG